MPCTIQFSHFERDETLSALRLFPLAGGNSVNGAGDVPSLVWSEQDLLDDDSRDGTLYEAEISESVDVGWHLARWYDADGDLVGYGVVYVAGTGTYLVGGTAPVRTADLPSGLTVTIAPTSVTGPLDVTEQTIYLRLDDTSEYRVEEVRGGDGETVDLSVFAALELLLETRAKQQLEILPVTVINNGAGFKFQPTTETVGTETSAAAPHLWSLRDPTDKGATGEGRVIAGGPLVVRRFATRRGS